MAVNQIEIYALMVGETLRPEQKDDDALSFDERMRKAFQDAYESGELPRVSFAVFLSEHGTPEDIEALPELLEKTDVYIPEAPRHTRRISEFYRDVAAGNIIPEEAMRGDSRDLEYQFLLSELQMLYATNTAVTFIDTPRGNKIGEALMRLIDEYSREIKIGKAFDELLVAVKIISRKDGEVQKDRDEYMLSQVVPQLCQREVEMSHSQGS